jgi:hypothetical protein
MTEARGEASGRCRELISAYEEGAVGVFSLCHRKWFEANFSRLGLSNSEFARLLSVSEDTIANWRYRQIPIRPEMVIRLQVLFARLADDVERFRDFQAVPLEDYLPGEFDLMLGGYLRAMEKARGDATQLRADELLCLRELCSSRRWAEVVGSSDPGRIAEAAREIADVVARAPRRLRADAREIADQIRSICGGAASPLFDEKQLAALQVVEGLSDFLEALPPREARRAVDDLAARLGRLVGQIDTDSRDQLRRHFLTALDEVREAISRAHEMAPSFDPARPEHLIRLVRDWAHCWIRVLACLNSLALGPA